MSKKNPRGWSMKFATAGHDMTFTYQEPTSPTFRRVLTIDTRFVPSNRHEAQQWFLMLLGRIWWDITEVDSFSATTRVADEMVTTLFRHREATP